MNMQNTADKIKKRDKPNDVFYTPIPLVKTHLEFIRYEIKDGDSILDPFFGSGNYYNLFPDYYPNNNYDFTEIVLNKDFFDYDKQVDVIVSNPPYSIFDKVLKKSVELNPVIISYLIGLHNLTTKRIEYMNKNGYYLTKIKILKVFKWFGMSAIVVFKRGQDGINCMDFDRIVYR